MSNRTTVADLDHEQLRRLGQELAALAADVDRLRAIIAEIIKRVERLEAQVLEP